MAGGLRFSGIIDKDNFNTLKTPGWYQCFGVGNENVGIHFWGVVLILDSKDYVIQLLIGNTLAWRISYDKGMNWGKFTIVATIA